jgi:pimeloyl-ACP methyl ester carboxylesterase
MKFNKDNGYIAYDKVGNGTPLLFIHGYPLSRKIWKPQLSALSDLATVLSIDLRGHGESFPFDPPYSMDCLADDCKALLDANGIKVPSIICGLSMGGYVALAFFRKYPHSVKALILTSTRASADTPQGKTNREVTIKDVQEHGLSVIAEGMLPKVVSPVTLSFNPQLVSSIREIMLETSVQGVIGASQGMRDRPDSTSLLYRMYFPVLVIQGADDQIIPLPEAQEMKAKIPNATLAIIPNAGHLLNMEQPDIFNQAVRKFIRNTSV